MSNNTKEEERKNSTSDEEKPRAGEEKLSISENNEVESESSPGLNLPNGEINWDCPCLDGMASGPCGSEFKESFLCMYNTVDDQDNPHCLTALKNLFSCISLYPDFYRSKGFSDEFFDKNEEPKADSTESKEDKTEPKK